MKPPRGVKTFQLWWQSIEDKPSLEEWVQRYVEVSEAVERFRAAGIEPMEEWLIEIGTHPKYLRL